jgi:DNA-directed RNA polymerase specialized sigma24 family protein
MRASLEELSAALTDIEGMVEQLTGVYRAVIIRRYLLGETFATIAVKLNYSERHIKRIHRKAIERMMMDGSV